MNPSIHHLEVDVEVTTSFQDADPMGVIYHGNYFRYFEEARRVLLDEIEYGYLAMTASGYQWPVIEAKVKYVKALPFNHAIRIHARMTEWENRLRIDYTIFDTVTGKRMCKAHTTQVAVSMATQEMCLASPKVFTEKVEQWHKHGVIHS
ncbi:acyl-CoA thioesterase [Vibrio mangrovi]|uniref:1,4-dihydroxy-2-naphthoyl-CoA hydrolase n=1 Tax=Vibrio mangrovi TaxID=474394 RepID=A0A1Y6ITH4_9VIBR|nr:acyl-CoA thioesterase [Vibrio mangrovi]MDW6001853.1 acyl-CoA thioesterase [Vibrio mangrovi]SMS00120.1 1,4-dihydroxy-2-naphthoyl-CoA hydrolase [Vibrio mangrovi]